MSGTHAAAEAQAPLQRTESAIDGYWGESAGHAVDMDLVHRNIDEVQAENELFARAEPSNRPDVQRLRTRSNSVARTLSRSLHLDNDVEAQEEGFDLRKFLEASHHPDSNKPLGVAWDHLGVTAPAKAVAGGTFAKTFPVAVGNTFWRDPWAILTTLIPPLARLGNKAQAPILHPTSGVLRAGDMLLVLGSPGSGCTTFLRAITSSLDPSVNGRGDVTYGGLSPQEVQKH